MDTLMWIISVSVIVLITIFAIYMSIKAHHKEVESGVEAFVGKIGTAKTDINPRGKFYVYGEYWDAETKGEPLKAGDRGVVVGLNADDAKYLIVEKLKGN